MAKKAYIGVDGVARKIKKGYVGVENFVPKALPSGYTQVEYIESDGAQYINSLVNGKSGLEVYAKWMYTNDSYKRAVIGCLGNGVRTYPMHHSASNYGHAYQSWVASSLVMEANVIYDLYTKLYSGEQVVVVNGETVATGTKTGEYDSESPMYIFALYNEGSPSNWSIARLYSMQIYDHGTLVRDFVPCMNASGTAGLYDMANSKFYANAGSGELVAGATHSSFARKIKKAYIGIGGVARPCWSGGELAYYGKLSNLTAARYYIAATHVGDYALFAGGYTGQAGSKATNAYNTSLTRSTPTALGATTAQAAGASVGNYALFSGGSYALKATVYAYNTSLTISTATALSEKKYQHAGASVGGYALFAGGYPENSTSTATVDRYNTSLTKGTATALSKARYGLVGTNIGNYALFAGGSSNVVDAYDTSLTRTTPTALSTSVSYNGAATNGKYAIFGGGATTKDNVDAYDASLVKTVATPLSTGRGYLAATGVGEYALFGGGWNPSSVVDAYDTSLTRTIPTGLSKARTQLTATSVGNCALFAGGYASDGYNNVSQAIVDAYVVV